MDEIKSKRGGKPRQVPASIYMGVEIERIRRLAELDRIAQSLGLNRSELIQEISDGHLIVVRVGDE